MIASPIYDENSAFSDSPSHLDLGNVRSPRLLRGGEGVRSDRRTLFIVGTECEGWNIVEVARNRTEQIL